MAPVTVLILAPEPARRCADRCVRVLDDAGARSRSATGWAFLARRGRRRPSSGASPPTATPFGARLRRLVAELRPAGLVVLGAGSIPLATARRPGGVRRVPRRPTSPARSRTTATRRTSSRSPGPGEVLARAARTSLPTTRCRAGSPRPPPSPSATSRRGGGWRSTSTRRSTSCCSRAPRRAGPARPGSCVGRRRPRPAGGAARDRGGPERGAARRRPHLGRRPALARAATRGRGPGPWSRSGACGRRRPAPSSGARTAGRPGACSASCSSATARHRSARHVAAVSDGAADRHPGAARSPARRGRGAAGRRPRTGSPPTSCSRTGSATRGCASSTAAAPRRGGPDPARRARARRARGAAGARA